MNKKESFGLSLLTCLIGLLFIIFKGGVISIAMTIIGAFIIVFGILYLINELLVNGLIWIVIGILIIVFGWIIASVVIYILAILFIIVGVYNLVKLLQVHTKGVTVLSTLLIYGFPICTILIGLLLCFNQGSTIDWIFILSGILLLLDGFIGIVSSLDGR